MTINSWRIHGNSCCHYQPLWRVLLLVEKVGICYFTVPFHYKEDCHGSGVVSEGVYRRRVWRRSGFGGKSYFPRRCTVKFIGEFNGQCAYARSIDK